VGGTALVAGGIEFDSDSAEFRCRVLVDAGQVSNKLTVTPANVFVGVGAGVRYYTAIGPIRLDLALPTKPTAIQNQSFQVYIGLGQAFLMLRQPLKIAAWVLASVVGLIGFLTVAVLVVGNTDAGSGHDRAYHRAAHGRHGESVGLRRLVPDAAHA